MTATPDRPARPLQVFDTTLRDGAQREGINLTVADKLAIARLLDEFGVGFIEGGWPGANPKDTEFFARARTELPLRHAVLVAFGATRRAGSTAAEDPQVQALLDARTPVVCVVAKSDVRHVERALRTTRAENLAMVADTVTHLVTAGRRVFVDCEHFFDGYAHDPGYALEVVRAAAGAGAETVVLCDTNGGQLPHQVERAVRAVAAACDDTPVRLGIHAQDDTGCAVANTLAAVVGGASHVQCTANGYGERVGNANLFSVVGDLELRMDTPALPTGCLAQATRVAHAIAEIVNLVPDTHQPYVGTSAFAHKAGLHASAIKIDPDLYQHVDPADVGNDMRILVSGMAGRASVELKGRELGYDLSGQRDVLSRIVERVKAKEALGYTFEAADASFELLLREELGERPEYFQLESWRVLVEERTQPSGDRYDLVSEATVKLHAKGERIVATGEGNGPVNALDRALRLALERLYPELGRLELVDYKVRILEGGHGTDAVTRVLVETSDGRHNWSTVGVHENVIAASWQALDDAVCYGLLREELAAAGRTGGLGGAR